MALGDRFSVHEMLHTAYLLSEQIDSGLLSREDLPPAVRPLVEGANNLMLKAYQKLAEIGVAMDESRDAIIDELEEAINTDDDVALFNGVVELLDIERPIASEYIHPEQESEDSGD